MENDNSNLLELADEAYWVSEWLIRNGGSFSSNIGKLLGEALAHADPINQLKVKTTWPELWAQGLINTAERRKNNEYY